MDCFYNEQLNEALKHASAHRELPSVIYTSRTHSQLTQAMKELKNSPYNDVSAISLGSRDQLCVNPEVLNEEMTSAERNNLCRVKIKNKSCIYRTGVDNADIHKKPIQDIEDLIETGRKCVVCPYYLSKELATKADIIFIPYNYVLDAKILKRFKIDLNDMVVIFDEAHNIEKVCEDSASISFTLREITTSVSDITYIMKQFERGVKGEKLEMKHLAELKEIMLRFENEIDNIGPLFPSKGSTFPGGKLFESLHAANITRNSYLKIKELIDALILYLTQSATGRKGNGLMKMLEILDTVYGPIGGDCYKTQMENGYRLHIIEPEKNSGNWASTSTQHKPTKIFNYWCFAPRFGMSNLLSHNVRSVILTSGTLAPFKPLISELAIKVDQQLENPHIIKESQVAVRIVSAGPDEEPLHSSYLNRDNLKYLKSLGLTIQAICRITPNGVLVFFSSYTLMNKCKDIWSSLRIWQGIEQIKPIFLEPRDKKEFDISVRDYYDNVKTSKGAIYMAVLRGKVSEGIDFNDHNARAVIICGIPFPPAFDPRVKLKQAYLDGNRNNENQLQSGQDWYDLEAIRAVNQAIGRVIRHKDDYGIILLCDSRFHAQKTQLSKWIQPHLIKQQRDVKFENIIEELATFFRTHDKISAANSIDYVKRQIKSENPNDIYGTSKIKTTADINELDQYIKNMKKPNLSDGSFFSELNKDVSVTIDFNSTMFETHAAKRRRL